MADQEHICAFCILGRRLRPRLRWCERRRAWVCPVCRAAIQWPTDPDRTAQDLAVMFRQSTPEELRERADREWEAYNSQPRVYHPGPPKATGGGKSGRRRKQPVKRRLVAPLEEYGG